MEYVYLDHAATTKICEEAFEKMLPFLKEDFGNPSSLHEYGLKAKTAIFNSRKIISEILKCSPQNIIFTSGGTEGNNHAILSALKIAPNNKHIITSKIEHHSVLNTIKKLEKQGYIVSYIDVDKYGVIDVEQLKRELREDTALVSIMHANNEIGSIQPIEEIGELLKNRKTLFHVDAVQSFSKLDIYPKETNIDLLTASAHKFYGPKGCGFIYIRDGLNIESILYGGNQQRNLRPGTENVAGIVGMAQAAQFIYNNKNQINEHEKNLSEYFINNLSKKLDEYVINGHLNNRIPGNISISFSMINGEAAVIELDRQKIAVSSSAACMAGQAKISHVIEAIGVQPEFKEGTIRITIGKDTTKKEIDYALEQIESVVTKMRNRNPYYVKN